MKLPDSTVIFQVVNGEDGTRTEPLSMAFCDVAEKLLEFTPAERFAKDYVLVLGELDSEGEFNFVMFPMMVIQTFVERYMERESV